MTYVYHGSHINGLKTIEPRKSTHGENWVYATKSKCIATIFLKDYGSDFDYRLSGQGTKENPAIIVERKPGRLEKCFSNGGTIYTLNGENFEEGKTSWSAEAVSKDAALVIKEETIDCILDELEKYVNSGELILYRYPERPKYMPLDNSDLIDQYMKFPQYLDSLKKEYPELTDEINKRLNKEENYE